MGCTSSQLTTLNLTEKQFMQRLLDHYQPCEFPLVPVITLDTQELIRESWKTIVNTKFTSYTGTEMSGASYFYDTFFDQLFHRYQEFSVIFNNVKSRATVIGKVMAFCLTISRDNLTETEAKLKNLGRMHQGIVTHPYLFGIYATTLHSTIRHCLGDAGSANVMSAWLHVLAFVLRGMMQEYLEKFRKEGFVKYEQEGAINQSVEMTEHDKAREKQRMVSQGKSVVLGRSIIQSSQHHTTKTIMKQSKFVEEEEEDGDNEEEHCSSMTAPQMTPIQRNRDSLEVTNFSPINSPSANAAASPNVTGDRRGFLYSSSPSSQTGTLLERQRLPSSRARPSPHLSAASSPIVSHHGSPANGSAVSPKLLENHKNIHERKLSTPIPTVQEEKQQSVSLNSSVKSSHVTSSHNYGLRNNNYTHQAHPLIAPETATITRLQANGSSVPSLSNSSSSSSSTSTTEQDGTFGFEKTLSPPNAAVTTKLANTTNSDKYLFSPSSGTDFEERKEQENQDPRVIHPFNRNLSVGTGEDGTDEE